MAKSSSSYDMLAKTNYNNKQKNRDSGDQRRRNNGEREEVVTRQHLNLSSSRTRTSTRTSSTDNSSDKQIDLTEYNVCSQPRRETNNKHSAI
jgi:hypothetical protein